MPELPEIETARNRLQGALKGRKIVKVYVDKDDLICYDRDEPSAVARALRGATVTGTGRKGKYFWLELDRKPWLLLHLGMTGNVEIRERGNDGNVDPLLGWGGLTLWRTRNEKPKIKAGERPRFTRLFLTLDDGTEVAITDPRRFGRIRLSPDPQNSPSVKKLGFDPMQDFPTTKVLRDRLGKRQIAIKAALLDQTVFAGVGNWIADEVLYQAKINPHLRTSELSPEQISKLRSKLLEIIRTSVDVEADYDRYPASWLFHHRWGKAKDAKDHRGRPIMHETIGGRTTAWVPDVQY